MQTFLERLAHALTGGLRLIQIRDKGMTKADRLTLARTAVELARPYHALVLVSGDAEMAQQTGAHGIQLDSETLMNLPKRPDVEWVGASCHTPEELAKAGELADFAMLSPVLPTASHPGEPTLGWPRFETWAAQTPIPVYALGGQTSESLATAINHGGHGIAMLREAWR
jgi:8-oxo-dGTP diphosphatase